MMTSNIEKLMILLQCDQPSWLLLQFRKILVFTPTIILQLIIVFLLLKLCFLMIRSMKKLVQKRKIFVFSLLAVFFILLLHQQQQILKKRIAWVVKESAFVYAGPEPSFHVILQLKSGAYVQLIQSRINMSEIMVHGQQGWIVTDDIEIL